MSLILGLILSFSNYASANATCAATVICDSCGEVMNDLETAYASDSEKAAWKNKCQSLGGKFSCANYGGCGVWVCQKWTRQSFPLSGWGFTVEMAKEQLQSEVVNQKKVNACSGGNTCGPCNNGSCGSYNRNTVQNGTCKQQF